MFKVVSTANLIIFLWTLLENQSHFHLDTQFLISAFEVCICGSTVENTRPDDSSSLFKAPKARGPLSMWLSDSGHCDPSVLQSPWLEHSPPGHLLLPVVHYLGKDLPSLNVYNTDIALSWVLIFQKCDRIYDNTIIQ